MGSDSEEQATEQFTSEELAMLGTGGEAGQEGVDPEAGKEGGKDAGSKQGDHDAAGKVTSGKATGGKGAEGADAGDGEQPKEAAGKKAQKQGADAGEASGDGGDGEGETEEGEDGDDVVDVEWPEQGFPDDWRERALASLKLEGDALKKAQDRLKRHASMADFVRSHLAADAKITEVSEDARKRPILPTAKDAKPEDIKAFHKAWGVPEDAKDYKLPDRPKDLGDRSEEDLALLAPALERFRAKHFSQDQVTEMVKAMDEAELAMAKGRAQASIGYDREAEDELTVEYGSPKEYRANRELANRVLTQMLGPEMKDRAEREEFLSLTFDNGRKIGSYPAFFKALVNAARNGLEPVGDDGLPAEGEPGGGVDLETRKKQIIALAHTGNPKDEAEYKRLQPELNKIIAALDRRAEKAARAKG